MGFELESKEKRESENLGWVVGKGVCFFAFSRASGRFLAVEIRSMLVMQSILSVFYALFE